MIGHSAPTRPDSTQGRLFDTHYLIHSIDADNDPTTGCEKRVHEKMCKFGSCSDFRVKQGEECGNWDGRLICSGKFGRKLLYKIQIDNLYLLFKFQYFLHFCL